MIRKPPKKYQNVFHLDMQKIEEEVKDLEGKFSAGLLEQETSPFSLF